MEKTGRIVLIVSVLLASCVTTRANVVNGGFESGDLTGWTTTGIAAAVTGEYSRDFLGLTQPPPGGTWLPTQGSYFASLWSTDSAGMDAATLSQTFQATAAQVLRFDYFFDFGDVGPYYDTAIATLLHPGGSQTLFEHNTTGHELGDDENLDWTTVSCVLPVGGAYTLEFRTEDGAGVFESILGIDNVDVAPVIPVPGAIALGGIGIGLVGWLRRRRVV